MTRGSGPRRGLLARRLIQLYTGLTLYGVSMGLMVRADLGLEPWSVLNQGISRHTGLSIGTVTIVSGALILLLWIPLRQRPGLGTVSNVVILGVVMDATMAWVPELSGYGARIPLLAFAVLLNGAATGLYISARFGPGPRDGLMTGLHQRTGRPVRLVRTCIEVTVLAVGFLLGGSVGAGTVVYALAIGPLAQLFLRLFAIKELAEAPSRVVARTRTSPERAILPE
ncbi:YitT family protein [Streptomyces sp. NPDC059008]|uniref:membrane protein YczE n=1 Tax=Streptomyces sp. NPDC059008 TaxID=3346693 RepID=UPI0036C35DD3